MTFSDTILAIMLYRITEILLAPLMIKLLEKLR